MLNIISYEENTNQNLSEVPPVPNRIVIIKKTDETIVSGNVEKSELLYMAVRNIKCCSHFEK